MAPMLKRVRIVVTCFFLLLCVLFAALWVRSYLYGDNFEAMRYWKTEGTGSKIPADQYTLSSVSGVIFFRHLPGSHRGTLTWDFSYRDTDPKFALRRGIFGFYWRRGPLGAPGKPLPGPNKLLMTAFSIPHWFLVLVTASLAIAIKPKPHWHFSLRQIVVFTTLFAVLLGIGLTVGT
jgi:hypothetical protein